MLLAILFLPAISSTATAQEFEDVRTARIGFPTMVEQVVIPGSKLISKQIENREQPMIVRIVETYPHGDDFRYDLEYTGLDPGDYNLVDYLEREDKSDIGEVPAIDVEVKTALPPGQILPKPLEHEKSNFNHFYLAILLIGGALWLAGLFAILFTNRGRTRRSEKVTEQRTVADRLKPLIDQAVAGDLDTGEKAELERVLNAFWSKKLRLQHLSADQLRKTLREHDEASKILNAIDHWIHRPDGDPNVDVASLLQPYQEVNYEDL